MKTLYHQRGMSALGVLFILLVISFSAVCVVKLLPHYMDSWTLSSAIERSIENNEYEGLSAAQIRNKIGRYLQVNRLDVIKPRDIKIKKSKGVTYLDATYEKRVPLMFNVDVVIKFDKLTYEFATK